MSNEVKIILYSCLIVLGSSMASFSLGMCWAKLNVLARGGIFILTFVLTWRGMILVNKLNRKK